jgi:tetrapyrrole methylase family protein/MazG family protein
MTPGRVLVVGLGPGGADLVLPAARTALSRTPHRFVRTSRHPAVDELTRHGLDFVSFDERYDAAEGLEEVYAGIVATLVDAARERGTVAYAVPGSPAVAERTVVLLHAAAARGDVTTTVVPGLSFADLAWTRLGIDAAHGQVLDAQRFTIDAEGASGPLLVAQCDSRLVLSEVKLELLERLPAATEVTVIRGLGLAGERIFPVRLEDLDRVVEPDHLTSLFLDTGDVAIGSGFARFVALMERLRGPGGCPWDAEQTHHSLARYTLEEAYEVVESIEALPADAPAGSLRSPLDAPAGSLRSPLDAPAGGADGAGEPYALLADELGDLLSQVVFHSVLAREAGAFTVADVIAGIHTKLVRRHPHVFADAADPMAGAQTAREVMRNWEQIKKAEKGTTSLVAGLTPGLPSLLYTHKLLRKAASVGLDPGDLPAALDRIDAAAAALRAAGDTLDAREAALADLLAAAVVAARAGGIDAESVLRGWAARFRDRFVRMEALAGDRGVDLGRAGPDVVAELWADAAARTGH